MQDEINEKVVALSVKGAKLTAEMLQKAIENGEIRNDIDLLSTAKQFMTIFYGQVFLDALFTGLNICTLSEQLYNLYNLLKK